MSDLEACMRKASAYARDRTDQQRADLIAALSASTHDSRLLLVHMLAGEIEEGDPGGAEALRAVLADLGGPIPAFDPTSAPDATSSTASANAVGREPMRFKPQARDPAQSALAARLRK